jgi:pimeloyl-ACP methyl ester carboxylesterase
VSFEKTVISGVPVLVSRPVADKPAPFVLLSHGFTRSKEDWPEQLEQLGDKGYVTVAMDNRLHGERTGAGFDSLLPEGKLDLPNLRRVIQETAADISMLIDHFSRDEAVDAARIAVVGVSMGGFVSFAALVNDARITVEMWANAVAWLEKYL